MSEKHWTPGKGTPEDYVIACFDDAPTAEVALSSLRESGFADDELLALHGFDAYEDMRRVMEKSNLRQRLCWKLEKLSEDSATTRADYLEEIRQQQSVVLVYAPREEHVASANRIVDAAHADRITHRGRCRTQPHT